MMKPIDRPLNNIILIILLNLFANISFSQVEEMDVKIISFKKVLALELCNKNEFNLCSNFSPTDISKNPEFINLTNGELNYGVVYRMPPIDFKKVKISFPDEKTIYDSMLQPSIETDTLKYSLTKRQIRKVKKQIINAKKTVSHDVDYSFDGNIKYLLYNIEFECVYEGKGKTYTLDKKGCDLIIEKEAEIYYITKIISIKPIK